ncbi:MAG: flagellar filament capping protein FliD [Bdellovibrionales bacterium]|nr:flagellar filament capping protein FliD [Bdellovibrionales bacterium]
MPIRLPGVGSGLSGVVDQIMIAEREPIKNMEVKKQKIETKLNLVTDFESRLNKVKGTLKDIVGGKKFQDYSLDVSDPDVIAGTVVAEKAIPGNWKLEVVKLAESAGALSNTIADKDKTQLGVGYLKFNTPDGEKSVYINNGNNTLDGIAKAINGAELGVNATVVQDGTDGTDGYRLIMSSSHYGNNQNVEFPTIYLLDGDDDLYFDEERKSKNGVIRVNGFDVEVVNNKIDEIIPGVSLDLKSAKPGKEVNIALTENYQAIEGKLKGFVEAMNGVFSFVQQQNTMNEKTDTSKTLGGDSVLRSIENRLRQMIQGTAYGAQGTIKNLSQLGVEFNRSGTLELKQEKFEKALKTNAKDVLEFLRGDGSPNAGFIGRAKAVLDSATSQQGVVSSRKKGMQTQMSQIDRNIDNKEKNLANKEDQLRKKFSKLEEQMSKMQAQGAQVSSMGGGGGIGGLGG